ncbi:MAG: DUF4350 domain-containing protein [bacterium]
MRDKLQFTIIVFSILFFVFGSYKIMTMRYKKGDVYHQYSSLRHDPMGTSILFQALKRMGYKVETIMEEKLPEDINPQDSMLFYLSPSLLISKETRDQIISFILRGGRVFISDEHNNRLMGFFDTKIVYNENDIGKEADDNNEQKNNKDEQEYDTNTIPLEGADFTNEGLKVINKSSLKCKWTDTRAVFKHDNKDIILLLSHGRGNIIISSENYFVSNESLIKEPPARFLTWLLNGRKNVFVDEYHHGISYKKGTSFLLKKYNLYWFISYLGLVFFLYLWHVLPYFQTPLQRPPRGNSKALSSLQGYTQLLNKTIQKKKLMEICINQWIKGNKNRFSMENFEKTIERLIKKTELTNKDNDEVLVNKYNEISNMIKERDTLWKIQPR